MKTWDVKRYYKLQDKRANGKLDKDEKKELQEMALHRLFTMIEADPDVKAAFEKLSKKENK